MANRIEAERLATERFARRWTEPTLGLVPVDAPLADTSGLRAEGGFTADIRWELPAPRYGRAYGVALAVLAIQMQIRERSL